MTDRLPNSPGKYSAVVTGAELQKMQTGEPFAITLQLDDDPVREGTPYSKAAVLPDQLAAKLCPETEDPAPKDAFRGLWEKKADGIRRKSGTVISIEDSAHTPLKGLKLFGKTMQDGTPTHTAPVELESVGASGNIGVTVAGKNLLPPSSASNGSFTANGNGGYTSTDGSGTLVIGEVTLEAGKTYTISATATGDIIKPCILVRKLDGTTNIKNNYSNPSVPVTYTPTETQTVKILLQTVSAKGRCPSGATFYIQLEIGSAATAYEPYKEIQTLTVSTPNGLPGIPVSSGGNYIDKNGQAWICDEIDFARGVYVQRIGRIDNYASETVAEPYLSTTGELSGGATVLYVLEALSDRTLSAEDLEAYAALHTNEPNTTVLNDAGADMEISYYTPNAAVPVVFTPKDAGNVLSIDEHGCVALTAQKDRVVEQGVSGIWTYRKWDSGIAECWSKYTATVDTSNAFGGSPVWDKFYRSHTSEIPLPVVFAEVPMFNVSVSGGTVVIFNGTTYVSNSMVNMIQLNSYVRTEDTSKSYSITYCAHAIGRWK